MPNSCPICTAQASSRRIAARSGKELTLWHCDPCNFDFLLHDPTRDLEANKLDDSRLKSAGLDIPTLERDFANGLAQSRPLVREYLGEDDKGANVLEIGCSWGYFLQLARESGAKPHGVELNEIRARYVNDDLKITCHKDLEAFRARGTLFRKIFLFYVLEYIPEPLAYLQRLIEMLEPGGQLIVITPSLDDALKDIWRNEAFLRFFYDEHAINYLTPRSVQRMLERLTKGASSMTTRQGYSFVNHVSWFLTNGPRTTGIVGGDKFVLSIVERLRGYPDSEQAGLGKQMAELIARFDEEYRQLIEQHQYGNQIRIVITR